MEYLTYNINHKSIKRIFIELIIVIGFISLNFLFAECSFATDNLDENNETIQFNQYKDDKPAYVWELSGDSWYLYDSKTKTYQYGWREVDGCLYYLNSSGVMETGWLYNSNKWYYLSSSGAAHKGWLLDGAWYYLDSETGEMLTGLQEIGGSLYYMSDSGSMATGWVRDSNRWYYFSTNGSGYTGWLISDGKWYYLSPDSWEMLTGLHKINGEIYFMDQSGAMETGWIYNMHKWYYLSSSGAASKGWLKAGGTWYYLDPNSCEMVTGVREIDGVLYFLNSSGAMESSGFVSYEGDYSYYANKSGRLCKAEIFKVSDGNLYYADELGRITRKAGWIDFNGHKYYAYDSGKLICDRVITLNQNGYYSFNKYGQVIIGKVYYENTQYTTDEKGLFFPIKDKKEMFLDNARRWIGFSEKDGSFKEIIDTYNSHHPLAVGYKVKYDDEWCDTFVSAVAISSNLVDRIGTECGCERHVQIFKNKNIWIEDGSITPKAGDIIVYHWDVSKQPNDGFADHIGIVTSVQNGYITVIEGNMDERVGYRKIPIGWGFIRGFARPNYY